MSHKDEILIIIKKIKRIKKLAQSLGIALSHPVLKELIEFESRLEYEKSPYVARTVFSVLSSQIEPVIIKKRNNMLSRSKRSEIIEPKESKSADICTNCGTEIDLSQLEKHPKTGLCIKCYNIKSDKKLCCDCAEEIPLARININSNVDRCAKCQTLVEIKRKY